jgi:hypothetical protein
MKPMPPMWLVIYLAYRRRKRALLVIIAATIVAKRSCRLLALKGLTSCTRKALIAHLTCFQYSFFFFSFYFSSDQSAQMFEMCSRGNNLSVIFSDRTCFSLDAMRRYLCTDRWYVEDFCLFDVKTGYFGIPLGSQCVLCGRLCTSVQIYVRNSENFSNRCVLVSNIFPWVEVSERCILCGRLPSKKLQGNKHIC